MIKLLKHKLCLYKYRAMLKIKRQILYNGNNGLKLKQLKHKYQDNRCFIVGNGPSLNIDDLDKLQNEVTFGFNRIYHIFKDTNWRPDFYVTEDIKIIENSLNEIKRLKLPYIFTPDIIRFDYGIDINNAIYFNQQMDDISKNIPGFSEDIISKVYWGGTVAYTAIQIAVYMGFKEIYLIGVDHNFSIFKDSKGNIVRNHSVKDYFCEEYNYDKEKLYIPNLDNSTKGYIAAKEYCDKNGIKIYNATRGGKLEVFERKHFDELF